MYVKILITTPKGTTNTAFAVDEFEKYIAQEVYDNFAESKNISENIKDEFHKDLAINFNDYAPKEKFSVGITEVTTKKPMVDDATMDILTLAEYALNCYKEPAKVLNNISDKLYQHKQLFGGRKLTLNSSDSIKSEKGVLREFYKNFQQQNAKFTEQKSQELISFVREQSQNRGR